MTPGMRTRRARAALAVGLLVGVFTSVLLTAEAALADDGTGSPPVPVSVTIPGDGPSDVPTSTPTPSAGPAGDSSGSPGSGNRSGRGSGSGASSPAPARQPGAEPALPKHPATGTLKLRILHATVFRARDLMTVTTTGLNPGEKVQLAVYYRRGASVKIGSFPADAQGGFSRTFALPALDPGTDTVQVTGWDSGKVGTQTFLLGATTVVEGPSSDRILPVAIGSATGLIALALLACFGFIGLRRSSVVTGA